jgi:hypothetical protein
LTGFDLTGFDLTGFDLIDSGLAGSGSQSLHFEMADSDYCWLPAGKTDSEQWHSVMVLQPEMQCSLRHLAIHSEQE